MPKSKGTPPISLYEALLMIAVLLPMIVAYGNDYGAACLIGMVPLVLLLAFGWVKKLL